MDAVSCCASRHDPRVYGEINFDKNRISTARDAVSARFNILAVYRTSSTTKGFLLSTALPGFDGLAAFNKTCATVNTQTWFDWNLPIPYITLDSTYAVGSS